MTWTFWSPAFICVYEISLFIAKLNSRQRKKKHMETKTAQTVDRESALQQASP